MQPLCEEITLGVPLAELFASLLTWPDPVFLDSSLVSPQMGRYSYIAADPFLTLSSKNGRLTVRTRDGGSTAHHQPLTDVVEQDDDPFAVLRRVLRRYPSPRLEDLPPFQGGAIGYFGYELGRHLEELPRLTRDDVALADLYVGMYAWVLAHDHLQGRTWLMVNAVDDDRLSAAGLLQTLRSRFEDLRITPDGATEPMPAACRSAVSNFGRSAYLGAIARAKEYIAAGDIYQVCLSQRFVARGAGQPWPLYRRLRAVSPAPYGAYLGFADVAIASASPELFLRLESGSVQTRPIKGTRPRGELPGRDAQLVEELRTSEKERAENLMIVDLLRNDLGRVCRVGTVGVPDLFGLESYSTVHHLVSTVCGQLRQGLDAVDLLRACFPGGSVTGCPKIRAMEIIDELEPTQRGPYCGAIGFIGFDGEMDTSITIRTIVIKDGSAYFQVGGAIVADSDPAAEYQETLDKARGILLALGLGDQPVGVGRAYEAGIGGGGRGP